ncbi:subunit of polyadenylation factor I complex [Ordospora colligata]|uniref:Subunit of polyadenylation factor I complex n=1 Tax=Ordospora colligata OC4 TaxID=1354746 RepID=A0A0B2UI53_9MICR|nr:subunit of polyadenylation factor I complex [Ordospora colligata OC4]KHN68904.1 subunit of polyadenylation factor I complex [Ordospora colligata OC4]TBU13938.1 subunit of polyadenylation factor I complex [Ordospora colligata]TBU14127.1 subunit of polyadenylation factor I complex [Ordospora colligata]TBU17796.1 subunit of polyadenylation factor I complex [Ordospora colligata]
MQNDEEFFVGDEGSSDTSSDLELVINKVPERGEEHKEDAAGQSILDYDIDIFTDKPWNKPGADITDYFNYGFNEMTWKEYCSMQRRKSEFTLGSEDWADGRYSGVQRGFSEIKREGEGGRKEKSKKSRREERDGRSRTDRPRRGRGRGGRSKSDKEERDGRRREMQRENGRRM